MKACLWDNYRQPPSSQKGLTFLTGLQNLNSATTAQRDFQIVNWCLQEAVGKNQHSTEETSQWITSGSPVNLFARLVTIGEHSDHRTTVRLSLEDNTEKVVLATQMKGITSASTDDTNLRFSYLGIVSLNRCPLLTKRPEEKKRGTMNEWYRPIIMIQDVFWLRVECPQIEIHDSNREWTAGQYRLNKKTYTEKNHKKMVDIA